MPLCYHAPMSGYDPAGAAADAHILAMMRGEAVKQQYESDVKLGERYRDDQTGIEGVAITIGFFQFACERITLELVLDDGKLEEYTFDAPRLTHIESGKKAEVEETGGPDRGERNMRPRSPSRR